MNGLVSSKGGEWYSARPLMSASGTQMPIRCQTKNSITTRLGQERMDLYNKTLRKVALVAALWLAAVYAIASTGNPYQQIEQVTDELLAIIARHQDSFDENEQAYFDELSLLLDNHIDFGYIAKGVMGGYAKNASAEQREAFANTFRVGLIETYGRGLIGYSNEEVVLLEHEELAEGQRSVAVRQEIRTSDAVYPLQYTMGFSRKTQQWKIINVIINGINLGKTFRTQFAQSAQKMGGDLDSVIANWSNETTEG